MKTRAKSILRLTKQTFALLSAILYSIIRTEGYDRRGYESPRLALFKNVFDLIMNGNYEACNSDHPLHFIMLDDECDERILSGDDSKLRDIPLTNAECQRIIKRLCNFVGRWKITKSNLFEFGRKFYINYESILIGTVLYHLLNDKLKADDGSLLSIQKRGQSLNRDDVFKFYLCEGYFLDSTLTTIEFSAYPLTIDFNSGSIKKSRDLIEGYVDDCEFQFNDFELPEKDSNQDRNDWIEDFQDVTLIYDYFDFDDLNDYDPVC